MCLLVSRPPPPFFLDTITLAQRKRLEKVTLVYRYPPQVNAYQNTFET